MTQDADEQDNYRPDADLNEKVFANLIKDVEAHGNRLTTGDVGNRYLIQTLARNGEHELIYKMFNHEEAPGYGFQLKIRRYNFDRAMGPPSRFFLESLYDGTD